MENNGNGLPVEGAHNVIEEMSTKKQVTLHGVSELMKKPVEQASASREQLTPHLLKKRTDTNPMFSDPKSSMFKQTFSDPSGKEQASFSHITEEPIKNCSSEALKSSQVSPTRDLPQVEDVDNVATTRPREASTSRQPTYSEPGIVIPDDKEWGHFDKLVEKHMVEGNTHYNVSLNFYFAFIVFESNIRNVSKES